MEDPTEDYWEFDDYSQSYDSKGKLGWAWRKGLNLGKKMVVTGIVISSAPFVLPPLVVLSALGVAFSVPAGFAFVTYACSEKLMNKLLPLPSPSPLEENRLVSTDQEEDWFDGYYVDKGYEEDEGIDAQEREFEDDKRNEVEMRTELVEEEDNRIDDYDQIPLEEIFEEDGYGEDTGEYVEDEEKPVDISGVTDEEMRRETTGLIEEMKNEGKYDQEKQDISEEETIKEDKGTEEIPIEVVTENKGNDNLFVIPEEVNPDGEALEVTNGSKSEGTNEKVNGRESKGDDSLYVQAEPKTKLEEKLVIRVKKSGDHTATDVRLETTSDTKKGTLVISDADAREVADESGLYVFDRVTSSPSQTGDSVNKMSAGSR